MTNPFKMSKPFKFFYSTDWHYTRRPPETRIDNYSAAIERKIETFFDMGDDLGCDAYGVGGDWVDSAYLTSPTVIRLGKLVERKMEQHRRRLYYILGNHDVIAYNPESIVQTAFGVFLAFSNDMVLLTRQALEIDAHGAPLLLTGISSYSGLDKDKRNPETNEIVIPRAADWMVPYNEGKPHIHMVHGYASEKAILDDIPHTVIDDFRTTQATVTLGAHEHTGTPIIKLDNGFFYNPGSLGRIFASHVEMNRIPKYVMVTIYPDGTPELTIYPCPVAEPGNVVMNRSKLDEKKAKEALLAQARGNIQEVIRNINIGSVDLRLIVGRFEGKVRPPVMDEAKRRLNL